LELEPTGQRGSTTIENGRNDLDREKFKSSVSRKRKQIEL